MTYQIQNSIITKVRDVGYHFVDEALSEDLRSSLVEETSRLTFEVGNHVDYPINAGAISKKY